MLSSVIRKKTQLVKIKLAGFYILTITAIKINKLLQVAAVAKRFISAFSAASDCLYLTCGFMRLNNAVAYNQPDDAVNYQNGIDDDTGCSNPLVLALVDTDDGEYQTEYGNRDVQPVQLA